MSEYKITFMRLFSAPEIFILDAHGTKNRRRKPATENGVDLWRRFLERVSWVLTSHCMKSCFLYSDRQ